MLPFVFDNPPTSSASSTGRPWTGSRPLAEKQGFIMLRNWEYGFRNLTNSVQPDQGAG